MALLPRTRQTQYFMNVNFFGCLCATFPQNIYYAYFGFGLVGWQADQSF